MLVEGGSGYKSLSAAAASRETPILSHFQRQRVYRCCVAAIEGLLVHIEQVIEFVTNHPLLPTLFGGLLVTVLVVEKRKAGKVIGTHELTQILNNHKGVLVDLRQHKEFAEGSIIDALNIPYSALDSRLSELEKHRDKPVILLDAHGQHTGAVGRKLKAAGFKNVVRLAGGISTWRSENLPLVKT